jgi:hypothetical protein
MRMQVCCRSQVQRHGAFIWAEIGKEAYKAGVRRHEACARNRSHPPETRGKKLYKPALPQPVAIHSWPVCLLSD